MPLRKQNALNQSRCQILEAALASLGSFYPASLLLAGICALTVLLNMNFMVRSFALAGVTSVFPVIWYHWRIALDRKLLPLLNQQGCLHFDLAFGWFLPGKAKTLKTTSLPERMHAIRKLFFKACACTLIQAALTLCTLTLILIDTPS